MENIRFSRLEMEIYLAIWAASVQVETDVYRFRGSLYRLAFAIVKDRGWTTRLLRRLISVHQVVRRLESSSLAKRMIEMPDGIDIHSDTQVARVLRVENILLKTEGKRMKDGNRKYRQVDPVKLARLLQAIRSLPTDDENWMSGLYNPLGKLGFNDWDVRRGTIQLVEMGILERNSPTRTTKWRLKRYTLESPWSGADEPTLPVPPAIIEVDLTDEELLQRAEQIIEIKKKRKAQMEIELGQIDEEISNVEAQTKHIRDAVEARQFLQSLPLE